MVIIIGVAGSTSFWKRVQMEKRTAKNLKNSYIKVKGQNLPDETYGGSQNFYAPPIAGMQSIEDRKKQKMGCGVVALADLFLYMGIKNNNCLSWRGRSYVNYTLDLKDYKCYFDEIYDLIGGVSLKYGISGIKLRYRFNQMARRQGWQERAVWGFSGKKLFDRIEQMLERDIPVILCIPMMVRRKDKQDGLWLYRKKDDGFVQSDFMTGHYVVVTELFWEEEQYLAVSSWGTKYFIRWHEYETLIHTHFLGTILGNILYIR